MNPVRLLRQQLQSLSSAGLSHLPRIDLPLRTELPPRVHLPNGDAKSVVVAAVAAPLTTASAPVHDPVQNLKGGPQGAASPHPTKAAMAPRKIISGKEKDGAQNQISAHQGTDVPRSPASLDKRQSALAILAEKAKTCTRCSELAATRTQTVFGVGNPQARILFIGEAPGADEDKQGEPFVGKAGQLLNQIIAASRLKREEIYICNVLKCRPPGNRLPEPDECANCREYLLGQLATIDPEYIICWGTVAAQNLLTTTITIGKLRGRFQQFGRAKVLCTYHPSYLLRNPAAKKDVWQDMQFLMADMGIDLTAKS